GIVRAWEKAKETGVSLHVGAQATLTDGSLVVLLAQDRGGYANLCQLLTAGRLSSEKGLSAVTWPEVCGRAGGLIALWGGDTSLITAEDEAAADAAAGPLKDAFGDRLYAMVARHRRDSEVPQEVRLRARATRYGIPTVAAVEVLYHTPERRPLQDVLTCIRHGV